MAGAEQYNERNISQIPAMEVLNRLGYQPLSAETAKAMRGNLYGVVLKDVLYDQLQVINAYRYNGVKRSFSPKNLQQALNDIDEALIDGLVRTSEKIYDMLLLGRSYPEEISSVDGVRSFNINYIDWKHPENNVFHVVEEFAVEREDGRGLARPDIVLFINGIPFGVIECKKASIAVEDGIAQMLRNQGKPYIPQLFKYVQIVMATNKNETLYGTVGTPKKFWSAWKEDAGSHEYRWFEAQLKAAVVGRQATVQDKSIVGLFHPKRVLEMIRYFTLYDKHVKKIARHQQYFAVKEIAATIEQTDKRGNRQPGVIWHTQGSGKSLTMVMLAQYILSEMAEAHPQVLVITDRIELDSQIHQTFNHSRLKAAKATSGKNLVVLINDDGVDIVTSSVHKFDTAVRHQKPVKSKDIFVLIDESHYTQYGELHTKMKQVFPNACYLGFTGTPLMKKDKKTVSKFGGRLIHQYTTRDGVEDKAIVPLLYEGRLVEQAVNRTALDKRLEMITRNLTEKQAELLKAKWSKVEAIASTEQRIRLIADDIYLHYKQFYKGTAFKAMLATDRRIDAVRYWEAFEEYGDIKTAVIMSLPDLREGVEETDGEPETPVLRFWLKIKESYGDAQEYEERIKSEFVDGESVDILIVVDKLLTGFDAPRASVLYVDKPLKDHNLLQAIARVNRLYEGKDFGLVIDYRGLIQELDSAMKKYSGSGLENFDPGDLQEALVDVVATVGTLKQAYSNVAAFFKEVKNKSDQEALELALENHAVRDDFYSALSQFGRYMGIALESEHVYTALGQETTGHYKQELKFYQELRAIVKLRYSDDIDFKAYEPKMRKLMDTYIDAEDVAIITAPVDILNEEAFEEEMARLGSPRAKADAIRTRLTKSIQAKWEENPAYYKRFSVRIEQIIEDYRAQRISDAEYWSRINEVKRDYCKGYSGVQYPEKIEHNVHAQAFYGVMHEALTAVDEAGEMAADIGVIYGYEDVMAQLAIDVDDVVEKNRKVDWHNNPDVHKVITRELDDLLYVFKKNHCPDLSFGKIDKMIEDIKTVALRRY